ncbi:hypothetical protein SteCoe_39443 [Stentor coeruleus]|uniref:Tetratricopeptide repeat protein n=1 Tax=Stentor coeruleus TaxID=5963 RepID=A0A1R2AKQ3_9CILI|nr:hypothetical protein SteCoe_39443 [Stentor coeruleus]
MEDMIKKVTAEANSLQLMGDIEFKRRNYQEAHRYYRQAYDQRMTGITRMDPGNSKIYKRLAKILFYIRDSFFGYKFPNLIEAKTYAKSYIKIRKTQGKKSKSCIEFYFILALYYHQKINCDEKNQVALYLNRGIINSNSIEREKAIKFYKKCEKTWEKHLNSDHPYLAIIYDDLNEKKKALELYEKCKNILEKVLNSDHPDLAAIYNNLGSLYINLNDKKRALEKAKI